MSAEGSGRETRSTFAARLDALFARPREPGWAPQTNRAVAAALTARGYAVSAPYLSQLRSGQRANPSPRIVAALAGFFGVEPGYFYGPDAERPAPQDLALVSWLRCEPMRELLTHAYHVPPESLELLLRFTEILRTSEGLTDPPL